MDVFDLWLPILVTTLVTHVLCTLAWTVLPHHKPEWQRLPAEGELLDLVTSRGVAAGQYVFPYAADGSEAQSPEFKERQARCCGTLILWEHPISMGTAILKTLTFYFVAAFTIAYLASLALSRGAEFAAVFRVVTTVALVTHCYAHFPHVFWFSRKMAMELLDGVVIAVATGLIFASLWPAAI